MLQKPLMSELEEELEAATPQPKEEEIGNVTETGHPETSDEHEEPAPLVHPEEYINSSASGVHAVPEQANANEPAGADGAEVSADTVSAQTQALLDRITALESKLSEARTSEQPADASTAQSTDSEIQIEKLGLISETEDPSDFTLSAEGLNEYGNRVIQAAVKAAIRYVHPIITAESSRAVASYSYTKEFYERFPELRDKGSLVAKHSAAVEAEDPSITPQKLFVEVAKRSYKELGIAMPTASQRKPGFTQATSSQPLRNPRPQGRSIQQDVLDLVQHKGRR